ncbi:hypothetical protein [Chitinophaga caseinilytica]|uniref:hypothetical protein n=1 Tax=Chitinophaga caseinilytica TaxID=2267521 RepID=UPI003C2FAE0C
MADVYEVDGGTVIYKLELTNQEDCELLKQLFRRCGEALKNGFFFRGWHGIAGSERLKPVFGFWNDLLDLKITSHSLEFACARFPDGDFDNLMVDLWDGYDSNYLWFFAETPQFLPTGGPSPETASLPPNIQLRKFDADAILIYASPGMEGIKEALLISLGMGNRDTAV